MAENELSTMTVVQLRKLAKEKGITLGAGIDKAGIIQKLIAETEQKEADDPSGT